MRPNLKQNQAKKDLAKPLVARSGPSLCSFDREFLFVAGGMHGNTVLSSCEDYSILDDEWNKGPQLCTARMDHSSCAFERHIYVFCGKGENGLPLCDIERLDARAWLTGNT